MNFSTSAQDRLEENLSGALHLQKNEWFNKYYVRRIRERMALHQELILDDNELTAVDREMHRVRYHVYKDLLTMLDEDIRSARR